MDSGQFGRLVEAARERKGLTQAALAAQVGVQPPQISRIESGSKGPSYETLVSIAVALDIDLNLLKADEPGLEDPLTELDFPTPVP